MIRHKNSHDLILEAMRPPCVVSGAPAASTAGASLFSPSKLEVTERDAFSR